MTIQSKGDFLLMTLEDARLTPQDRQSLLAMTNEDTQDELVELMDEADGIAAPVVLFGVCPVDPQGCVNGVDTGSQMVAQRLQGKGRAFPYIATCGPRLEQWAAQYSSDYLLEFWADEIKKKFLGHAAAALRSHLKAEYRTGGHLAALNPGSLKDWPVSGQEQLFAILGGREFVRDTIGVFYTASFLMQPTKTVSGIAFESGSYYENCQYCPLEKCPGRRAKRIVEE